MTINTTTVLSDALRVQYVAEYERAADFSKLYDQYATPAKGMPMSELIRGSSVQYNYLSDLPPQTSTISQLTDVTPLTFKDASASITPTSRGAAIQNAEIALIQAYTNYSQPQAEYYYKIGKQMRESVDLLAQAAACQGGNVLRLAARASLDAGTTGHRLIDSVFARLQDRYTSLKVPGWVSPSGEMAAPVYAATMPGAAFYDLRTSGQIDDVGNYQQAGIVLNFELGALGPFRFVVSPWAKSFWGAGADNGSSVATTLNGATNALAKTIIVASGTNVAAGMELAIGTEETGNTFYETNERVWVNDDYVSGTTVNVIGEGDNGGMRFDHASGVAVRNADHVHTVVAGSPQSLACLYAEKGLNDMGEMAESMGREGVLVGPKAQGFLNQFNSLGWKYYGGYAIINQAHILRTEVSSSFQA